MSCLHIYVCQHILWEWQNVVINDTPAHICNCTHPVEINTTVSEWRTNLYTLYIISLSLYVHSIGWLGIKDQVSYSLSLNIYYTSIYIYIENVCTTTVQACPGFKTVIPNFIPWGLCQGLPDQLDSYDMLYTYIYTLSHLVSWIPTTCYTYTSHLSGWIPTTHYTYTSSHLAGFIPTMWYIYLYLSIYHILQIEHNVTSSECLNTVNILSRTEIDLVILLLVITHPHT